LVVQAVQEQEICVQRQDCLPALCATDSKGFPEGTESARLTKEESVAQVVAEAAGSETKKKSSVKRKRQKPEGISKLQMSAVRSLRCGCSVSTWITEVEWN